MAYNLKNYSIFTSCNNNWPLKTEKINKFKKEVLIPQSPRIFCFVIVKSRQHSQFSDVNQRTLLKPSPLPHHFEHDSCSGITSSQNLMEGIEGSFIGVEEKQCY